MYHRHDPAIGAKYLGNGRFLFRVWAPLTDKVALHLVVPRNLLGQRFRNVLTGDNLRAAEAEGEPSPSLSEILANSPVAHLEVQPD